MASHKGQVCSKNNFSYRAKYHIQPLHATMKVLLYDLKKKIGKVSLPEK